MSKTLSNLKKTVGLKKRAKRIGRGYGSGKGGHCATRGMKGQKSRSGGKTKLWFEGGQTPLIKRMPYNRGFVNPNPRKVKCVNFSDISQFLKKEKKITPELLLKNGVIAEIDLKKPVKLLSKGTVPSKVNFVGFIYSKTAREKITSAGGKAN